MLLNLLLFLGVLFVILVLILQIKKRNTGPHIIPICNFHISNPEFEIEDTTRIAKYQVITKNKDRYFRDFPIGFKFYSEEKFRSKIKITYNVSGDDEIEVIYDRVVEFEDNAKEHIYYINDVIVGSIDIEIYTDSQYGKPTILFELLQNNMCHLSKEHKLEIVFPN
jgi:hypothetical protein